MQGEHRPGYRKPRTGEKRETRQPLKIDKLAPEVGEKIQELRAQGKTWDEISDLSEKFAGERLAVSTLHRWYDIRVEQVRSEVLAQAERARVLAAAFARKQFAGLSEAALNAFSAEAFSVMDAGTPTERLKAAFGLVRVAGLADEGKLKREQLALDKEKRQIERERLELDKKKLETLGNKVKGLKDEVAKKKMSSEDLARKLDEIYDIAQPNA